MELAFCQLGWKIECRGKKSTEIGVDCAFGKRLKNAIEIE